MGKISREDLFREIGEIDEAYVEEARLAGKRRRRVYRAVGALAGAASLLLCVGVGYMTVLLTQPKGSAGGGAENAAQSYAIMQDTEGREAGQEAGAEEAGGQAVTGNIPERAGDGEKAGQPAAGNGAGSISAGTGGQAAPEAVPAGDRAAQEAAPDGGQEVPEAAPDGDQAPQEAAPAVTAEKEYAEETQKAENDKGARDEASPAQSREECQDLSNPDELFGGQSQSGAADLTWEAARADAVYGQYVDVRLPEGYAFTSAVRVSSGLHVIWNNGTGEISLSCRQADEDVSDWLVDVERPEEYDLSLYSIPWCDSVPQELLQRVNNATFLPDQLTLDIVRARSCQIEEAGDPSVIRIRLGILQDDNILVEIRSKGPTAEDIYTLLTHKSE